MYLEGVVRVNTAPAALLQLHLRVELLLVLLHDVRQVGTSTALCGVVLTVAVVMMVVMMRLWSSPRLWSVCGWRWMKATFFFSVGRAFGGRCSVQSSDI